MTYFVNYKNGRVTIDTYRVVDAVVTDVGDVLTSFKNESKEVLAASICSDDELAAVRAVCSL